jgi:hypothetical protein
MMMKRHHRKKLVFADIAVRVLGAAVALGLALVTIRTTPEMIRYLRMRRM